VIVANQTDNESTREVRKEEGEELSRSLYVPFLELSATNTSEVREAFFTLIREISYRLEQDVRELSSLFSNPNSHTFVSF
jgi:GTPase SAR1 family protein